MITEQRGPVQLSVVMPVYNEEGAIALAIDDVQRHDLLIEAVGVLGRAEVQLADRDRAVPGLRQPVPPAPDAAVIGMRVVPEADVADIAAGLQAGARRHADSTRRAMVARESSCSAGRDKRGHWREPETVGGTTWDRNQIHRGASRRGAPPFL